MKRSIGVALARRKDRSRSTPIWATHPPATSLLLDARHQRLAQLCEICGNVQRPRETDRRPAKLELLNKQREDRDVQDIFELFAEDSWCNVYAGEREVRPLAAPALKVTGLSVDSQAAVGGAQTQPGRLAKTF
jgi:hypothetical protein